MIGHVLDQQSLAVAAPAYALIPDADLAFGHFGEVSAADAEYHDEAVRIVERKIRRVVGAILCRQRDVFAVMRDRQAFDDLSDVERVDDARRFALQIDDADRIDIALSPALEAHDGR